MSSVHAVISRIRYIFIIVKVDFEFVFFLFITQDIDECADSNLNNCDTDATYTNTDGSYQCVCNIGYAGDGTTCQGIETHRIKQYTIISRVHIVQFIKRLKYTHYALH